MRYLFVYSISTGDVFIWMMTGRYDKNEEKQTKIHCIDFHSIIPVKFKIGLLNAGNSL